MQLERSVIVCPRSSKRISFGGSDVCGIFICSILVRRITGFKPEYVPRSESFIPQVNRECNGKGVDEREQDKEFFRVDGVVVGFTGDSS